MRTKRFTLAAASLGLLALAAAAPAQQAPKVAGLRVQPAVAADPLTDHAPGEILIRRIDRAPEPALLRARDRVGARSVRSFPSLGIEVWRLDPGMPVDRAVALLGREELGRSLQVVEPNWYFYLHQLPNDPRLPELWGLVNLGQTGGTRDADIDASEAWNLVTGSESVAIGVIDSGIDYLHEDLAANVWVNAAEAQGLAGVDDDGNGYVDDVRGWDCVNEDNDPMDDAGHGTHTSGTIGAVGDNGIGVTGVDWTVRLVPIKAFDASGRATTDDLIQAVLYASSLHLPITNNSWGGSQRSSTLESAIASSNALFVASAGNAGSTRKQYPAGYALDNILSVAATDQDDQLASFSNRGSTWVDLAAPGVAVLSTTPDDTYSTYNGTSMAAPHVTGVAGLLLAQQPGWGWAELKERILATVDPLASLGGLVASGGRLNAAAAVGAPPEPSDSIGPSPVADLTVETAATAHDAVTLTWTAPGDDGDSGTALLYDVRYASGLASGSDFDFTTADPAQGEPAPGPAGSAEVFTVAGLAAERTYYFALKTFDEMGNVSGLSNVVAERTTVGPPPETDCADGLDNDLDGDIDCADLDCVVAGLPCPPCGNHVCQPGETCDLCAQDCEAPPAMATCGDGICQAWSGENCQRCPADCNGNLAGKPQTRWCCGGGPGAVPCSDSRCTAGGRQCQATAAAGACCGDGLVAPVSEKEWTCGIDVCAPGSPGADPDLFVASYYFNWNEAAGLISLGAGSRYNLLGTPYADPASADVPECRVDCLGDLRAYYKDLLTGGAEGKWGARVSVESCQITGNCCSTATDWGFWVECCILP